MRRASRPNIDLQPLSAPLGHDACVPPPAWGAGSGLDEGDSLRVLGEGLRACMDFIAAVTAWFLALHRLALPSIRALVDVMVYEYSGKSTEPLAPGMHVPGSPARTTYGCTR